MPAPLVHRHLRRAFALALALYLTGCNAGGNDSDSNATEPVTLQSGQIQGERLEATNRYLGVPYAAPPVDQLRWVAPQDPQPWAGIKKTTEYGSACTQIGNLFASNDVQDFDQPYGEEDCLYLNVWQPSAPAATPRDVLVFVHGGSGTMGAASLSLYDGATLAAETGALVVTINYRLGILGSMHSEALAIDGDPATNSGSFALLDIIKALQWVQRNIAAFGGNPDNVTLMGQSAGGVSIWALLRSPLADGLFAKAAILSAIPLGTNREKLKARSQRFIHNLMNQEGATLSDDQFNARLKEMDKASLYRYLHDKSTSEILAATAGDIADPDDNIGYTFDEADGYVLPAPSEQAGDDLINAVPMVLGSTEDEAGLLLFFALSDLTEAALQALNQSALKAPDIDIHTLVPEDLLQYQLLSLVGNVYARLRLHQASGEFITTGAPLYRYDFTWQNFSNPWRRAFGAFHGLDLFFLFGNFQENSQQFGNFIWEEDNRADRVRIHQQLVAAMKGFMETGDPNTYPTELYWPRWEGLIKRKAVIH